MSGSQHINSSSTDSDSDDELITSQKKFDGMISKVAKKVERSMRRQPQRPPPPPVIKLPAPQVAGPHSDDSESLVAELDRLTAPLQRLEARMTASSPIPGPSGTASACGGPKKGCGKKRAKIEDEVENAESFSAPTVDSELPSDEDEKISLFFHFDNKKFRMKFLKGTTFWQVQLEVADRLEVPMDEITIHSSEDLKEIPDTELVEDIPYASLNFVLHYSSAPVENQESLDVGGG